MISCASCWQHALDKCTAQLTSCMARLQWESSQTIEREFTHLAAEERKRQQEAALAQLEGASSDDEMADADAGAKLRFDAIHFTLLADAQGTSFNSEALIKRNPLSIV